MATTTRPAQAKAALLYVVDDEPMLLELAGIILKPAGYRLQVFRDPQQALDAFAAADPVPDLILTDYSMQTMNGRRLMEACRKLRRRQKFLMVSGTVDEHFFDDSPVKPNRFLAKPYKPKQLLDSVRATLNSK